MLMWMGATSASMMLGCSPKASSQNKSGSCVLTPEQTEGPYFVDDKLLRSDIRTDPSDGSIQQGLPLLLRLNVFNVAECQPVPNAIVDVWHCNANGIYSDVKDRSFDTRGKQFLRGYQLTDAQGKVEFITIYPGWYEGRTVHIHFKVRTDPKQGKRREFTSQLYFSDDLSDQIFNSAPYSARGQRQVRNNNDFIYSAGGRQLTVKAEKNAEGILTANFDLGLSM